MSYSDRVKNNSMSIYNIRNIQYKLKIKTMAKDQKTLKLKTERFNGEKYSVWKFRIRELIAGKNALNVLENEPLKEINMEWEKSERIARDVIVEHLSDSIKCAQKNNSAREIFKQLDSIYERKSLAAQLAIEKKLLNFQYNEDMPLIEHFIIFDEMIAELEVAVGRNLSEADKVARLLFTLPNSI